MLCCSFPKINIALSGYDSLLSRGVLSYLLRLQKYSLLLEKPPYTFAIREFILFKQAFKVLLHIADPSSQLGLLVVHYFFPAAIPTSRAASLQAIPRQPRTWLFVFFVQQLDLILPFSVSAYLVVLNTDVLFLICHASFLYLDVASC